MMCTSFLFVLPTSGLVRLILAVVSHPDHRQAFEVRKRGSKLKHLGDPPMIPASQNFGAFIRESSTQDLEAFIELARGYVFQGTDQKTVCTINAEVSFLFFCCAIAIF